jgi:hypothetical protein
VFIASLSLSLLSYASSLANNKALDNKSLLVLNWIWFITTGGSLFIAGSTGIVAAMLGAQSVRPKSRQGYLRLAYLVIIIPGLFVMLFAMVTGLLLLANNLTVDTPLGNVHLPSTIIFPLLAIAITIMILVSVWMAIGA